MTPKVEYLLLFTPVLRCYADFVTLNSVRPAVSSWFQSVKDKILSNRKDGFKFQKQKDRRVTKQSVMKATNVIHERVFVPSHGMAAATVLRCTTGEQPSCTFYTAEPA